MTAASTKVWMPLYIGDYLADTGRLTTEQHGAYLLLMMDYWRSGPPPDDDQTLAQIARLPTDRWIEHRQVLARYFQIEGSEWRHNRIDRELDKAMTHKQMAVDRARKAAAARWQNEPDEDASGNASSNAPSNAQGLLERCPSPSPSPSPSKPAKPKPKNQSLAGARFVDFWEIYPRKEGKQAALKAWKKAKADQVADEVIQDVTARLQDKTQWAGKEQQFIPLPATYLNGRRWEDEWTPQANPGRLPREQMSGKEVAEHNAAEAKRAQAKWGNS